jgi:DNA/RNA endonuclease G (NUC1)
MVNAGIFKVLYSQEMEQPLEVWYKVECPNGTASRKGMDFYVCDSIHTSSAEDYENNVWDKGHMAPAASFSCNGNMIWQTFTYLNCALQHQDLN